MFEYRTAYERILHVCEGEIGEEIKKQLKQLPDEKVIECSYIINKYSINEPDYVYIIIMASIQDLKLKDIAMAEDKVQMYSELLTKKENKTDIYEMFERKKIIQTSKKYYSSEMFDKRNMPRQGWVINIAAKDYYDYRKVVLNVVPDLVKMKACFRVLSPKFYTGGIMNVITIYATDDFVFTDLTKKSQMLLLDDINANTNKYIFGRLSAIFQNFFGTRIIDASGIITDIAEGSLPSLPKGLEPMQILNYHQNIIKKYNNTENIVQYLQEFLVGIECRKDKIFYNVYLIESRNIEKIKELPIFKNNEDLNAICEFSPKNDKEVYYVALVVHDMFDDEIIRTLIREEIPYKKLKKHNFETKEEREERKKKEEEMKAEQHERGRKKREERAAKDLEKYQQEQARKEMDKYENQKKQDISKKYIGKGKGNKKKRW